MKKILILTILGVILTIPSRSENFNIIDYGAVQNQKSTAAIQKAIDACFEAGGGNVIIPAGRFITGTVELKSNVFIYLEPGSLLEASLDLSDYRSTFRRHGLVFCEDGENTGILGPGTINAMGTHFYDTTRNHVYPEFDKNLVRQKQNYMPEGTFFTDGPYKRLRMPGMTIGFYHCTRVKLKDFKLLDTPIWAIRLAYCEDGNVSGLTILNNLMVPNSDGIHMTASRNIRISDCHISCGDDAIIVTGFCINEEIPGYAHGIADQKAHRFGNKSIYSEHIQVTNCHLQSRSAGIRVGYGQHPIRSCSFTNIQIYGSNRGIGIFAHDGSDIENLVFSGITIETRLHNGQWWGNAEPIHISCVSRFEGEKAGNVRNVIFNDIIAQSEHGVLLYGQEQSLIEDVVFSNVRLKLVNGKETLGYGGNFDLRPATPISLQIFEHDIPGIYAQWVNNLTISNFTLRWGEGLPEFFTDGLECLHVNGLYLHHFDATGNPASEGSKKLKLEKTVMAKGE